VIRSAKSQMVAHSESILDLQALQTEFDLILRRPIETASITGRTNYYFKYPVIQRKRILRLAWVICFHTGIS
jgi:hypothetical protein